MVLELERESRLKSFSSLTVFWMLAIAGVGITYLVAAQSSEFVHFQSTTTNFNNYLFWTLIFLIPVYASLRIYSQWTMRMGFQMRFLMGVVCGVATALVLEAFIVSWLGGMHNMIGFQTLWGWPICVLGTFLLAPFRFDHETAVSWLIIFLAITVSMLVLF